MRRFTILLLSVICLVFLPSYVIKRGPSGVDGEKVLQQLYDLKYFAAVPNENFRNHYWFSSYSGSDSNPCTKDLPCRTLGKAKDVCLEYTRCTFEAGEVWSPLVLAMDAVYDFNVGETVTWNSGADSGVIIGSDPLNKIIVIREDGTGAGTDPDASDIIVRADAHPGTTGISIFNICGEATTVNNNTIYYGAASDAGGGPIILGTTNNGQSCDINAVGSAVVADEDEYVYTNAAFQVIGMTCRNEADANANISFTLLDDTAATTPSVTCTIADNERDCVADVQTTANIAAGSKIALAVASTGDIADGNGFVCEVFVAFDTAGGVASVTDTLGAGWEDRIDIDCDDGELCELWEGGSFENPPIFDCNDSRESGGAGNGVFSFGNSSDNGTAAIQNLQIQYCPQDAVSVGSSSDVDIVSLNVSCFDEHNGTADTNQNNNCFTSHGTGDSVHLNMAASGEQYDNASAGSPVSFTSTGAHTIITQKSIIGQGNPGNGVAYALNTTSTHNTIVGAYISVTAAGAENERTIYVDNTLRDIDVNFCRVTIKAGGNTANSNGISNLIAGTHTLSESFYETSIVNGAKGVSVDSDSGVYSLFARGLLVYAMSGCTICDSSLDITTNATLDLQGVYEDGKFWIESVTGRSKAQADAVIGSPSTFFETNSYASDGANDPWDNTADTLALPAYAIHPECGGATAPTSCYDVSIGPYNCQLSAPIPSFVTGNAISNLVLQGKIGAR